MTPRKRPKPMTPCRAWVILLDDGELAWGGKIYWWRDHAVSDNECAPVGRIVRVEIREVPNKARKVRQ